MASSNALDHRAPEFFPTPPPPPTSFISTNYYYYMHPPHHHYYHIRLPSHSHQYYQISSTLPPVPALASPPHLQYCGCRRRHNKKQYSKWPPRSRNNFYATSTRSCRDHVVDDQFGSRPSSWRKKVAAAPPTTPPAEPAASSRGRRRRFVSGELKGYHNNLSTVMIRHIPNRYTREMLKEFLEEHCCAENKKRDVQKSGGHLSAFDFLYLPIDFSSKWNKGYAFVNFTSSEAAEKFFEAADGKAWYRFHSPKIREICYARLQGKGSLLSHFERMEFPCKEFQPVVLEPACDGSGKLVNQICVGRIKRVIPS